MYIKDFSVFQAYYCGLCKELGRTGGPLTRLCTNYDVAFYNALLHSIADTPVKFETKKCYINWRKKTVVIPDELTKKTADIAVLLVYYNAEDDVLDGKRSRIFVKARLALRKRAAAKRLPEIDKMMKESFSRLHEIEKRNSSNIDEAADPFASLLRDVTCALVKTDEGTDIFTYNLGRLIYLFDAVDDVEKDAKDNRYNPLLAAYGTCKSKSEFLKKNMEDVDFLLRSTYNRLVGAYNAMHIVVSEGMLSNTVYLGIMKQMTRLLKGENSCQLIRL